MEPDAPEAGRLDDTQDERYAALHVEDAAMVIYDQDNHRAWVRSDHAVSVDGMV
jgi:hypothetical protein